MHVKCKPGKFNATKDWCVVLSMPTLESDDFMTGAPPCEHNVNHAMCLVPMDHDALVVVKASGTFENSKSTAVSTLLLPGVFNTMQNEGGMDVAGECSMNI